MKLPQNALVTTLVGSLLLSGLSAADKAEKPAAQPQGKVTYFDAAGSNATAKADGSTATFVSSDDPAVKDIAQYGFKTIERIGGMMISEVNQELATREIAQAVGIMHLKSLELPKPVAGKPTVTAIKRTSLMLRDPRNAPDAADAAALDKIHTQLMADESPDKMLVQKVERAGQPVEWRVYRPIAASQSCLACHGDPATFRPGVKAALDLLYPEDKAVEYGAKEWRGVIRVSLTAPTAAK
ncbi:MAG TPA: DUF3365 domain-containing protein [Lacunisphaera sp.]|nr:DUF3365 domain-containing protein [Lacunisphaera sp.]